MWGADPVLYDARHILLAGLILVAAACVGLCQSGPVVSMGARRRLAMGWTLQELRLMSGAVSTAVASFLITVLPFATPWLLFAGLATAGTLAYRARGWMAVRQLLRFVAILSIPYLLAKAVLAVSFPGMV